MGSSELGVTDEIKNEVEVVTLSFQNNCMKENPDKFHFLLSDIKNHQVDTCNRKLWSTCSKDFFWLNNDNKPYFEKHVEERCKIDNQKVIMLSMISSLMKFKQTKCFVNSLITFYFSYCPLPWMFHCHRYNNCIYHIHQRALKIIHQGWNFSFV